MDILDQRSLALIPQPIRWIVLAFLGLATLLSAGFAIWLTVAHGSDALVVALLSIFKASAIGTALWFFFLIGQRAQSRSDLLRRTSRILADEIPASLHIYGKPDELEGGRNRGATPDDKPDRVHVEVDHAPATVHARYVIAWPGLRDRLQLRVHLNVKVLSLVYFSQAQIWKGLRRFSKEPLPRRETWVGRRSTRAFKAKGMFIARMTLPSCGCGNA
ncbi:MAG TPA: hypothetical protein VJL61_07295 [Rhodanobacteraceae bacterium]|nr:hypothetical protein [Rhodanobacteraceae bacterium]